MPAPHPRLRALPRAARVAARLVIVPSTGSTNTDLVALAADPAAWPHLSVLVTDHQTSGRGRLDRVWQAPAGASLAASVVLRPTLPSDALGWLPLLAGVAMARAVRAAAPAGSPAAGAAMKWPNDVLVDGRKLSGILAELLPDGRGVVVGAGLNLTMARDELPVETATSLVLEGVEDPDADAVLAAYLEGLRDLVAALEAAGDAAGAGLPALVAGECDTIGRQVRVELPGGRLLEGRATGLDDAGRLLVETDAERLAVAAGDVTHLRY